MVNCLDITLKHSTNFADFVFLSYLDFMQAVKALWMPFDREFGEYVTRLEQHSKEVGEEIRLASEQAANRERQLQMTERKDAAKARNFGKLLYSQVSSISAEDRAWRAQRQLRESHARKGGLLDTLSTHDYVASLKRERKKRYGTTGLWLSKSKAYQDWLNNSNPAFFWLSGILGSGKTVLTAAVIAGLLESRVLNPSCIAFFFCQYDNSESLQAKTILRCLLKQCLTMENLSKVLEDQLLRLLNDTLSDTEGLDEPFAAILNTAVMTHYVVIDGFDEVSRPEREIVLSSLQRMCSFSKSKLKIFLSSRQDIRVEVERAFPSYHKGTTSCSEVRADIVTYINLSLEEKRLKGEIVVKDPSLIDTIKDTLIQEANGMLVKVFLLPYTNTVLTRNRFLWVFFQIEEICAQTSDDAIREAIRSLPKDLPETYTRALTRIINARKVGVAVKMFRWVAISKRPLLLTELREAIAVEPCQPYSIASKLVNDIHQMIPWCGNLLVLDEEEHLVQFAHQTVKEYLLTVSFDPPLDRFHFSLADADHTAGEVCCTYLNFCDFERQLVRIPNAHVDLDPKAVIENSLSINNSSIIAKSWLKLERIWRSRQATETSMVWRHLHFLSLGDTTPSLTKLQTQYSFLAYASEHWLLHTANFRPQRSKSWHLWKKLVLTDTDMTSKPWTAETFGQIGNNVEQVITDGVHRALLLLLIETKFGVSVATTPILHVILWPEDPIEEEQLATMAQIVTRHGAQQFFGIMIGIMRSSTKMALFTRELYHAILDRAMTAGHLEALRLLFDAHGVLDVLLTFPQFEDMIRKEVALLKTSRSIEMLELLLGTGAIEGYHTLGPWHLKDAAASGNVTAIDRLIAANMDLTYEVNPNPTIKVATRLRHLAIIKRLLRIDSSDEIWWFPRSNTAFFDALNYGSYRIACVLLATVLEVLDISIIVHKGRMSAPVGASDALAWYLMLIAGGDIRPWFDLYNHDYDTVWDCEGSVEAGDCCCFAHLAMTRAYNNLFPHRKKSRGSTVDYFRRDWEPSGPFRNRSFFKSLNARWSLCDAEGVGLAMDPEDVAECYWQVAMDESTRTIWK